jgi:hypothetical protein
MGGPHTIRWKRSSQTFHFQLNSKKLAKKAEAKPKQIKVNVGGEKTLEAMAENPDQFKAMAFLGKFLYYQGKLDEPEPLLKVELSGNGGEGCPDNGGIPVCLPRSAGEDRPTNSEISPPGRHSRRLCLLDGRTGGIC